MTAPHPPEAIVHVPVGEFSAGSTPGEPGRNPALEARASTVRLGPFRIDALPYPGDGATPPRRGVSRDEAEALCAAKKGRLCTEVEWERACKGAASSPYPGGSAPCSSGYCQSDLGVYFQSDLIEHTRSMFGADSAAPGKPVVRGQGPNATPSEQRCAARSPAPDSNDGVGFRCCYGAPNAERLPEPSEGTAFTEVDLEPAELKRLFELDPVTRPFATRAKPFAIDAASTVLARGPGDTMGFTLTTRALDWRPSRGVALLVVVARLEPNEAIVAAFHRGKEASGGERLAGTFLMKNEAGPIALGYAESIRPRMHFSGCWGCPGETGKLLFREPEEIVLLQP